MNASVSVKDSAPDYIALDASSASLSMHWPDGSVGRVSFAELRAACMCAQCRKLRLGGGAVFVSSDVRVLEARPIGYGLQLVFDDGHDRGIYPWEYLMGLVRER